EAMFAAKPFVATAVGGTRDLCIAPQPRTANGIELGENGFLVDSSSAAAIDCLERLASDPALASRMGASGQQFAQERFSSERLLRGIQQLPSDVIGPKAE